MNRIRSTVIISIISLSASGLFFSSCKGKIKDGAIIFSRVAGNVPDNYVMNEEFLQNGTQASIVALDPDNPEEIKVLTEDYYSARSPEVSYDGRHLLFTARKKQNDAWQIWEMNLDNSRISQVTSSAEDCIYPAYLPGDRLVFSQSAIDDTVNQKYSLYTCNRDGSDLKKITFSPHTYLASTILKDGRVLTINRQLNPKPEDPMFVIMRPDGTKADMFYKGLKGSTLSSRSWETLNGKIVFTESEADGRNERDIVTIDYSRPLHSHTNYTSEIAGDFRTVFPLHPDKLLVSYRASDAENYAIYEFDTEKKEFGRAVYNNKDYNALELAIVEKHNRPKKLPSEVDMGVKTGLLLCQDINEIGIKSSSISSTFPKAGRIEILGADTTFGVVAVEEDGSFYLKVIADTPFQIQTIDEKGNVLSGPCDWIWLRPNERRGCVGCHEDPEQVPENRLPLSVKKSPVIIPVHIGDIKEKEISLE